PLHREMAERELERAGLDPEAGTMAARRAFGSAALATDQARDVWIPAGLRDLSHDVRFAFRLSVKDPGFTVVAVATLALGIGFNSTLFTIVSGMGSGPRVDQPDRVVALRSLDPAGRPIGVSYRDFQDWRLAAKSFDRLAAVSTATMILTDHELAADRAAGAYISAETFSLVGERPILGRDFVPADDRPGAERVGIIAASLWKNRYGNDPAIIGRSITVDGVPLTIVGIMREGFRFPLVHDVWQPLASAPGLICQARDVRRLQVMARLALGIRLEPARPELTAIASGL